MPPRDVGCPICGGRFFAHSLPIHVKQCEEKYRTRAEVEGWSDRLEEKLRSLYAQSSLQMGESSTKNSKSGPSGSTGASYSAEDFGDVGVAEFALSPCKICGRKFAVDRVVAHEAICAKVSANKRPKWNAQEKRLEGINATSYESYKSISNQSMRDRPGSSSDNRALNTNWRDQSKALREAMASVREHNTSSSRPTSNAKSKAKPKIPIAGATSEDIAGSLRGSRKVANSKSATTLPQDLTKARQGSQSSSSGNDVRQQNLYADKRTPHEDLGGDDITDINVNKYKPTKKKSSFGSMSMGSQKAGAFGGTGYSKSDRKDIEPLQSWGRGSLRYGGLALGNHTSADNPLATDPAMTIPHDKITKVEGNRIYYRE